MKLCIIVHSPLGIFKSVVLDYSEEEHSRLIDYLKDGEINYLTLDTEKGKSLFQKDMLKNCVISIEEVSE